MSRTSIKAFAIRAHETLMALTLEQMRACRQKGWDQAAENQQAEHISYTWFHRLVALRYMEVNGYLPDCGFLSLLCKEPDRQKAKSCLIAMCNRVSAGLPWLFPAVNAQTEELLSTEIFAPQGFLEQLLTDISTEEWTDAVELIGWLHQYYNTEQKNQTFGALQKENVKISRERIPAVTQLFTPDWIVRYLVDGALGGRWRDICMEVHAEQHTCTDMQSAEVQVVEHDCANMHDAEAQIAGHDCTDMRGTDAQVTAGVQGFVQKKEARLAKLQNLRFLDPCMGSGHILVYAFDVFMRLYRECGCSDAQAVREILQNNLYGMDIDPRAGQLAAFSVMMKARQYDATILDCDIRPRVYVIRDSRFLTEALIEFVGGEDLQMKCDLLTLAEDLYNATEYGSLTNIRKLNLEALYQRASEVAETYYENVVEALYAQQVKEKLLPLLLQARAMMQRYDVVVTNPPYMGKSAMDKTLRNYVKKQYPLSNHDLFAVFIEKCDAMLTHGGYQGMITQHAWMFLGSYEKLRRKILQTRTIVHMLHLGARAFEEISGEVVQTTAWIMKKTEKPERAGTYVRLVDFGNKKEQAYREECADGRHHITYTGKNEAFFRIPGAPVAYWVPEQALSLFETTTVANFAVVTNGMFTCDNKRFLRYWFEVPQEQIDFACTDRYACIAGGKRWFPYNKGGNFCRWYGNQEYVIDFAQFGEDIRNYRVQSGQSASFPGQDHYFEPSLSWSLVSPNQFGIRYYPAGFVFDIAGSSIFPVQEEQRMPMLAVLASEPVRRLIKVLNPTINYQAGDIRSIPMLQECLHDRELAALAEENVQISKELWDEKETSWNFHMHPLVTAAQKLRRENSRTLCAVRLVDCVVAYQEQLHELQGRLSANEARIDEIVGAAYGMPDVQTKEQENDSVKMTDTQTGKDAEQKEAAIVPVTEAEVQTLCRSLLSYTVGCMFGRFTSSCRTTQNSLLYLNEEDFIMRLRELLEEWFGSVTTDENLTFLTRHVTGKDLRPDDAQAKLLQYMKKQFYREHARMYHKRPIYWMLKSGEALLYIHRYQPDDIRARWPKEAGELPDLNLNLGVTANYQRLQSVLTPFVK